MSYTYRIMDYDKQVAKTRAANREEALNKMLGDDWRLTGRGYMSRVLHHGEYIGILFEE